MRQYWFSARDVARALVKVAGGASYRAASEQVRNFTGRSRVLESAQRHGQLVADWVEVFGPVIAAAYAPTAWPEHVVLDSTSYRHSRANGGTLAFSVLGAVGYEGWQQERPWALRAVPTENQDTWWDFLNTLDGAPRGVVTDGSSALARALLPWQATARTEVFRCEWHLTHALLGTLPPEVRNDPTHPLQVTAKRAVQSAGTWATFRAALDTYVGRGQGTYPATRDWVRRHQRLIAWQTGVPTTGPRSNGAVEQVLQEVRKRIGPRAMNFTNQARTNALLGLFLADMNGHADERAWADIIRAHAAQTGGSPTTRPRTVSDHGRASLRV
ncbi:hypothetical protein Q6348_07425 [Isoptericola sp. b441]|uniref:Mutator family transposase n=1 Tax=Actinotalea lenta TaxID=3064654 RepID=A0ABT9D826_9CELL|nr:hypothetical protein [Isoptericola sp. b441]MDO8107028.1 hypothetical protein [Isoptericola sp. b441]